MSGLLPLTGRELKKWYRNPTYLIVSVIQPIFWILLFGSAIDIAKFAFPGAPVSSFFNGAPDYITFLLGGILTVLSLFTAMFSGINIIWDRRLGVLTRFLASPIHRSSIVFSRMLASVVKIAVQAAILIGIAAVIPDGLKFPHGFTVFDALILFTAMLLISVIFGSIFSVIAIKMTQVNTIMGIVNLVNLPLMFASTALFPGAIMQPWLHHVAMYNPISWSADTIRTVIINGDLNAAQMHSVGLDLLYLFIFAVVMILITYFASEKGIQN
ncbi:ABC transporter permease [Picrophilus oshimae]|uniref:Daunorubicin resistance ATP-binding protein DrrB n=1 Tax=Picrophilus torridus (strain ATCC 700027 / DSM 9790 / JCM 10055 / NBRC 100828 / KAW 2/3) TaxID=1122961 RepID=Q6L020_PICTO|nr:ABC transporter permease [Picrophilus oshimae]AAT43682.1 daunorubicin resistance ATP-binding protein DrrB [Picrophilus oshimae DSM 9789]